MRPLKSLDEGEEDARERLLAGEDGVEDASVLSSSREEKLSVEETARLSLEFSMLWFAANYFASACLEYTSVASVTILTSTSSIWTLIFCAITKVEGFTVRKLVGVLASLAGVILISSVDLSGTSNDNRGSFPHKSTAQIAIGDAMAFFSAIIYGVYVTVMKRRVGNEERVNMPLFFGLVGLFNVLFLWPGFIILHYTGIEPVGSPLRRRCGCLVADFNCLVRTAAHTRRMGHHRGKTCWAANHGKRALTSRRSILPRPSSVISSGHMPCFSRRRWSSQLACR